MEAIKQNMFCYRLAQLACRTVGAFAFRPKMLRNEIKGKKGPFVVIANHQAAYDFVNLIGATAEPLTFVISQSFYSTLPVKGILDKIGVIPKQQFQTSLRDINRMKATIEQEKILVIYPAGLMCEDGVSTPIPAATNKFLKWMKADVYVARTFGTYFAMPKWAKGMRPGRTYMDIYKLFSREELEEADVETVKRITEEALSFNAYEEQEKLRVKYRGGSNVEGLENVLYACPHCHTEFSVRAEKNTLCCTMCGYTEMADKYGFLHRTGAIGEEIRYPSDWAKQIFARLKNDIANGKKPLLQADTAIHMIDHKKKKFVPAGEGSVSLTADGFTLSGQIRGEEVAFCIPITCFASLPFCPGKHFEIQHGEEIYRCVLRDGRPVMKFINAVKAFYEQSLAKKEARATADI